MDKFNKSNVNEIEVKVIHGNDSIYFYKKFGFKMQAHILMLK